MEFIKKAFCILLIVFSCFTLFAEKNSIYTDTDKKEDGTKDKDETKIPEYESIIDESNRLHLFSYKDENLEYLTVNKSKASDKRSVTVYSNDKVIRYFYDSDFYLSKIEKWKSGKTSADAVLEKVIFYEFTNKRKGIEIAEKLAYSKKVLEYNLIEKKLIENFYDESGLIFEKNEYDFIGTEDKALIYKPQFKNRTRISYSYVYKYDAAERIILDSVYHYEYKNNVTTKVLKKSFRKNVYYYTRVDCPPDVKFYEEDILRMATAYTSKNDYVTYVYFDHDVYVKAEYVNSRKRSETFYVNSEEKMKKIYE